MNHIMQDYLNGVQRYLAPERASEILSELEDDMQSRVEEMARKAGREPIDDDYRAVVGKMGAPSEVAARYNRERYLVGPSTYGPFFAYLGILFPVHLGISTLARVFGAGLRILPGSGAGRLAERLAEFMFTLPVTFIFDFGLVALLMWQAEHWHLRVPFPRPVKTKLPSVVESVALLVWGVAAWVVLNPARDFLFRVFTTRLGESYELFGPGFEQGLPVLNAVIIVSVVVQLVLLAVKSRAWRRGLLVLTHVTGLLGMGLFFAQPHLLVFPEVAGLPADLAGLLAKLMSVPVILGLTWGLISNLLAFWQETVAPRVAD